MEAKGYAIQGGAIQGGVSSGLLQQAREKYEPEATTGTVRGQLDRLDVALQKLHALLEQADSLAAMVRETGAYVHGANEAVPIDARQVAANRGKEAPEPATLIARLDLRNDDLGFLIEQIAQAHNAMSKRLQMLRSSL